jgi:hypothetical protein
MTKVFIGGSRRVTRLNADVQRRIDQIIEQGFPILVGDANGADNAVQTYLRSRRYHKVDVFCAAGDCRNNVGDWPIRTVPAPAGSRGFDYYAVKDDRMAEEASVGLMIWDSKSVGTLMNMARLLRRGKSVVVYIVPGKRFVTLSNRDDWDRLVSESAQDIRHKALRSAFELERSPRKQATLLW